MEKTEQPWPVLAAISPRGRRPRAARLARSGYALPPQARDIGFLILIVATFSS